MDQTTETIAHFAGLFDLLTQEARLRELPAAFEALLAVEEALADIEASSPRLKAPHKLEGYDPKITLDLPHEWIEHEAAKVVYGGREVPLPRIVTDPAIPQLKADGMAQITMSITPFIFVPLPNSFASYNIQILRMSDDDVLIQGGFAVFSDVVIFEDALHLMADGAAGVQVMQIAPPAAAGPWDDYAETLAGEIAAMVMPDAPGWVITMLTGSDANGVVVSGTAADSLPEWNDVVPEFLRDENADADDEEPTDDDDTLAEGEDPAPEMPEDEEEANPYAVDPGHAYVTGGNLSANEAHIATNWIDAPVIAVAGNVFDIDAISQVSMLIDKDSGFDGGASPISSVINAAEISRVSQFAEDEDENGEDGVDGDPEDAPIVSQTVHTGGPLDWEIVKVSGDVISYNTFFQTIFATDNDRMEVTVEAAASFISTGENILSNFAALTGYGFHYDLIIVGGDMINVSQLVQTTVLLDSDYAVGTGPSLSGGDNLVMNKAAISEIGIDTYGDLPSSFAGAAADLAAGGTELAASVAESGFFENVPVLRALFIEGDLIEVSLIEQLNVFGDADQIAVAAADFLAGLGEDATVTAGSNAVVNSASVTDYGLDSMVLAGGDVYSDALLYQAEFIDTNASPNGVAVAALANEAVAFLADDLIDEAETVSGGETGTWTEGSGHADLMQTMLA